MVAGAVRKSKSDIVLSTLAVSLYTEWQGHIGRSAIGRTRARGWADFQYLLLLNARTLYYTIVMDMIVPSSNK